MFKKSLARAAGLLVSLLLATGAQAALVTQSFNFLSNEFTLRTTVQFDNAVDAGFPSTAGLTVNEFTTTLIGFTLPTLRYRWLADASVMTFGGGNFGGTFGESIDDVVFSYNATAVPALRTSAQFQRPADTLPSNVTNLAFNQDPFSPPVTNGVPEPSSLALVALAGLGLMGACRRRT